MEILAFAKERSISIDVMAPGNIYLSTFLNNDQEKENEP
jgi:hypothetical protein